MLYDSKRWDVKTDPLVASFIAWAEQQPQSREYSYTDYDNCVLGQWRASLGLPPVVDADKLGRGWNDIAQGPDHRAARTIGAALKRARELAARNHG